MKSCFLTSLEKLPNLVNDERDQGRETGDEYENERHSWVICP